MATKKKKKPATKKNYQRELTREVTKRFLIACHEIIAINKRNGGKYSTLKALATSIHTNAALWTQYRDNPDRNVTLEMCAGLATTHNIDGHWLLTGNGDKYHKGEAGNRLKEIEKRLKAVEARIRKK
jgi:hypothetical protein